jgi:hypothetical protein
MENKFSPVYINWCESISREIQRFLDKKNNPPLILPVGADKIVKCINSSITGDHTQSCINMIKSYCQIVARDTPQHYYHIKINLLTRVVEKNNELLAELRNKAESIKL